MPLAILTGNADGSTTIDIVDSFEVKESLKGRGYKFGRERVVLYFGTDLIRASSIRPSAAWYRRIEGVLRWDFAAHRAYSDETELREELEWIAAQGWSIARRGPLDSLVFGLIEGRPETVDPSL